MTAPSADTAPAHAIDVHGLWKRFGQRDVVRDVSFHVDPGEVVGMVGPNGAGKTTAIRMLLDILRPDAGAVTILGEPLSPASQERIGYLPEERGLYDGLPVLTVLEYLGRLKGLSGRQAAERSRRMLETVGLEEHGNKKIRELSRGMGQLIQFAATILHQPDILVLDEPFSGLDPVNVRRMKDIVLEISRDGVAVIFSTHQMTDVEELCDRVLMIDQGEVVLEGPLLEIRRSLHTGALLLQTPDPLPDPLPGVTGVTRAGDTYTLRMEPGVTADTVLRALLVAGCDIERFEQALPSLEEIFIRQVERRG